MGITAMGDEAAPRPDTASAIDARGAAGSVGFRGRNSQEAESEKDESERFHRASCLT
jgi:hypothetical protein